MDYVIIYAHPGPKSFNRAILERVESILRKAKKTFEVRDLYASRFNPSLGANEIYPAGHVKIPQDVEREQNFIREAAAMIFIYPIWWFGMPAILKGYIDRVFSEGFAYSIDGEKLTGLLTGKKAVIINTTGGPRELFARTGYEEAMRKATDSAIIEFCGMEIVEHRYLYGVQSIDDAARKRMLDDLENIDF
jgi:NAD(P)H dehydrogenase (quinone)